MQMNINLIASQNISTWNTAQRVPEHRRLCCRGDAARSVHRGFRQWQEEEQGKSNQTKQQVKQKGEEK